MVQGRTESARIDHLDLLLEVGLGIGRRFNEEQHRKGLPALPQSEVSFWYLARHLGRRFLPLAERRLGSLEAVESGLWRARVLEHTVWLVSSEEVPLDRESLPVHLVSQERVADEKQVAGWIVQQPGWLKVYSPWLALFTDSCAKMVKTHDCHSTIFRAFSAQPG